MNPSGTGRRPLVFAHRGGSGLAPENTMEAFETGLALGVDGIELDVHLSADGVAVVMHDPTLERTTNARGRLADTTVADLTGVDAGFAFERAGAYPWRGRGCRVPLLREVLRQVPRAALLIELKTPEKALARVVADEVRAAAADERVIVGSFHQSALDAVREYAPHLRRGADRDAIVAGLARPTTAAGQPPPFHAFLVPEVFGDSRIVTPEFIGQAHAAGIGVFVWTVDREDDIVRLLAWGADGIMTDRPDVAVPAVHRWWSGAGAAAAM